MILVNLEDKEWVRYLQERYKEQTIFQASLELRHMYAFHLSSELNLRLNIS